MISIILGGIPPEEPNTTPCGLSSEPPSEFRGNFRKNAPWDLTNLTRKVQALDKDKGGSGGEKVLPAEIAGFAYREIDAFYTKMMDKQSGVALFNELEELFELGHFSFCSIQRQFSLSGCCVGCICDLSTFGFHFLPFFNADLDPDLDLVNL